tara:strand:- start:3163 stop:4026 length:864 start_codon:yes stop_codon:yes gene_type:complete
MAKKVVYKKNNSEKKIKESPIIINDHEYVCLKPDGPTDNSPCATEGKWGEYMPDPRNNADYLPEYEALCKCHKQEHLGRGDLRDPNNLPPYEDLATKVPLFREPMSDELEYAESDIDECKKIREELVNFGVSENYLGCLPPLPDSPLNCDCSSPYTENIDQEDDHFRDSRFSEYIRTSRTYSTFWDTPRKTPLIRKSLMNLYSAQVAVGSMPGNLKLKVGDFIEIVGNVETEDDRNSLTGTWLVAKIVFTIPSTSYHKNIVTLMRDTKGTLEEKLSLKSESEQALDL